MWFRTKFIVFIIFLFYPCGINAQIRVNPRHLNPPAVTWDGDLLTGEVKNVPVGDLLRDLLQGRLKNCSVTMTGELPGTISIRFEDLTVEDIIHRVMRNSGYNYTLVSIPMPGETGDFPAIYELTIYQGERSVRIASVPARVGGARNDLTAKENRSSEVDGLMGKVAASKVQDPEDIEKLSREFEAFLDEMLASGDINREEYEKVLKLTDEPQL